jgi:UDP-N-acetylmuramoyl-L-alanyl-D-glutamate--2,6-diaminopimelate ligase
VRTVAVTGTNGKTSTTAMIAAIVRAAGEVDGRLTTVGAWVGGRRIPGDTRLEEYEATRRAAAEAGVRTFALETTSLALAGGFAQEWPPDVAVFTNLTRDHLDLHGSPEAYLAAKAQLFLALRPGGVAVLNRADPASELLAEVVGPGVEVRWYHGADLTGAEAGATELGSRLVVGGSGLDGERWVGLPGSFQVSNALAAALAARSLGYEPEVVRAGLASVDPVPGRFEVVGRDPLRVVDYAHTPDGLRAALGSARRLARGRVVLVFGCGGERDAGKRPEMGAIADELADVVVLTTDNPRREDPAAIARAVRAGAPGRARWIAEPDRAAAIARARAEASREDLVLVAGKGHETAQDLAGGAVPFSDASHLAPPRGSKSLIGCPPTGGRTGTGRRQRRATAAPRATPRRTGWTRSRRRWTRRTCWARSTSSRSRSARTW